MLYRYGTCSVPYTALKYLITIISLEKVLKYMDLHQDQEKKVSLVTVKELKNGKTTFPKCTLCLHSYFRV